MTYLIGQIILCLIIAAILGAIIGWWLKQIGCKNAHASLEGDLRAARDEIGALKLKLEQKDANAQAAVNLAASVDDNVIDGLRADVARLTADLDGKSTTLGTVTADLDRNLALVKQLRLDLDAANAKAEASAKAAADATAAASQVKAAPAAATGGVSMAELIKVKAEVKNLTAKLEACSKEREALTATVARLKALSLQYRPKVLLRERPTAPPDDLKKISGVGPKLEGLLNELGVYFFSQVAAFTDEDVQWVDDHLEGFNGRIERDNWVQQAKDFVAAAKKG